jgi:pyrimidine deaminase RibD-like protein
MASLDDERLGHVIACLRDSWASPSNGLVAAGIFDSKSKSVTAASEYAGGGRWYHAERLALERFRTAFGAPSSSAIAIVTLAPCTHESSLSRIGDSCASLLLRAGIRRAHVGAVDRQSYTQTEQDYRLMGLEVTVTLDRSAQLVCERIGQIFGILGKRINDEWPSIKSALPSPWPGPIA